MKEWVVDRAIWLPHFIQIFWGKDLKIITTYRLKSVGYAYGNGPLKWHTKMCISVSCRLHVIWRRQPSRLSVKWKNVYTLMKPQTGLQSRGSQSGGPGHRWASVRSLPVLYRRMDESVEWMFYRENISVYLLRSLVYCTYPSLSSACCLLFDVVSSWFSVLWTVPITSEVRNEGARMYRRSLAAQSRWHCTLFPGCSFLSLTVCTAQYRPCV
jgi:hypothetical protein